jgi:amino acid transporter
MVVYIGIALAVFGNLPPERVIATREFALAEAARPILGHTGFAIVAVTALVATASAINASLYAVTNVTYQLAREGGVAGGFRRAHRPQPRGAGNQLGDRHFSGAVFSTCLRSRQLAHCRC